MIWRPVPNNSTFKPKVTLGDPNDNDVFNISIFVTAGKTLRHDDIVAGKASSAIPSGDHIVFDVVLTIFHKPAKPIALDLGIFDSTNKVVQVSDGKGGKRDAECNGTFSESFDAPIMIKVVALP
jgi:hypothetical protein